MSIVCVCVCVGCVCVLARESVHGCEFERLVEKDRERKRVLPSNSLLFIRPLTINFYSLFPKS